MSASPNHGSLHSEKDLSYIHVAIFNALLSLCVNMELQVEKSLWIITMAIFTLNVLLWMGHPWYTYVHYSCLKVFHTICNNHNSNTQSIMFSNKCYNFDL